jgi:hypothetical protein
MTKINKLSPKQQKLIDTYLTKWKSIIFSTDRIDKNQVNNSIEFAYKSQNLTLPQVETFASPNALFDRMVDSEQTALIQDNLINFICPKILTLVHQHSWENSLDEEFNQRLKYALVGTEYRHIMGKLLIMPYSLTKILNMQLMRGIRQTVTPELLKTLINSFQLLNIDSQNQLNQTLASLYKNKLINQLINKLHRELTFNYELDEKIAFKIITELTNIFNQELEQYSQQELNLHSWDYHPVLFDFCLTELNCPYDPKIWEGYQLLMKNCGWLYSISGNCLVSDRPQQLLLDEQRRLHAIAQPAIIYTDNYSMYSYQGVILPKKYGNLPIEQWQERWIAQEKNPDIKNLLNQVIGKQNSVNFTIINNINKSESSEVKEVIMINELTFLQERNISIFQKKWQNDPPEINHQEIETALQTACNLLGKTPPKAIKFYNENQTIKNIINHKKTQARIINLIDHLVEIITQQLRPNVVSALTTKELISLVNELEQLLADDLQSKIKKLWQNYDEYQIMLALGEKLESEINNQVDINLQTRLKEELKISQNAQLITLKKIKAKMLGEIMTKLENQVGGFLQSQLGSELKNKFIGKLSAHFESYLFEEPLPEKLMNFYYEYPAFLNYCISVLKCQHDQETWQVFKQLAEMGGGVFVVGDTCVFVDENIEEEVKPKIVENQIDYTQYQKEKISKNLNNLGSIAVLLGGVIKGCAKIIWDGIINILGQLKTLLQEWWKKTR